MHRWITVALLAIVGATVALPATAQWKWRDARGQTQYSDTPTPPSVAEKDILQRPAAAHVTAPSAPASAASGAPGLAPKGTDSELETKRKQTEQEAAEKKKADEKADAAKAAASRAENCTRAKAQMRTLDSGMRIARTNAKGEREYLDDKARAEEAQRTRDALASECK